MNDLQRFPLFCANRQKSLATAWTNFTEPWALNKGDLCKSVLLTLNEVILHCKQSNLSYLDTSPHCSPPPPRRPRDRHRRRTSAPPPYTPATSAGVPLRTSGSSRSTGTTGSTRGTASRCRTWGGKLEHCVAPKILFCLKSNVVFSFRTFSVAVQMFMKSQNC